MRPSPVVIAARASVQHRITDCRMRTDPSEWWIACLCGERMTATSDTTLVAQWWAHGGRGGRSW